jgi:hypothetical protein
MCVLFYCPFRMPFLDHLYNQLFKIRKETTCKSIHAWSLMTTHLSKFRFRYTEPKVPNPFIKRLFSIKANKDPNVGVPPIPCSGKIPIMWMEYSTTWCDEKFEGGSFRRMGFCVYYHSTLEACMHDWGVIEMFQAKLGGDGVLGPLTCCSIPLTW